MEETRFTDLDITNDDISNTTQLEKIISFNFSPYLRKNEYNPNINFEKFIDNYGHHMINLLHLNTNNADINLIPLTRNLISLSCGSINTDLISEFINLKKLCITTNTCKINITSFSIIELEIMVEDISFSVIDCPNLQKFYVGNLNNKDIKFIEYIVSNHQLISDLTIRYLGSSSKLCIMSDSVIKFKLYSFTADLQLSTPNLQKLITEYCKISGQLPKLDFLSIGELTDISHIETDKILINNYNPINPNFLPKGFRILKIKNLDGLNIFDGIDTLILNGRINEDTKVNVIRLICHEFDLTKTNFTRDHIPLKCISKDIHDKFKSLWNSHNAETSLGKLGIKKNYNKQLKKFDDLILPATNVEYINDLKLDIYDELLNSNFLKKYGSLFKNLRILDSSISIVDNIPPTVEIFFGYGFFNCTGNLYNLREIFCPNYQIIRDKKPKMIFQKSVNPNCVISLSFHDNNVDNWGEFLPMCVNLQYLHITYHQVRFIVTFSRYMFENYEIPLITSDKLVEYSGFIGLGNLPSSIKSLNYNLCFYQSIEHLCNLELLRIKIRSLDTCHIKNSFVKEVELGLYHTKFNGIIEFDNLKKLTVRVSGDNYDFLLNYLTDKSGFDLIVVYNFYDDLDDIFSTRIKEVYLGVVLMPIYWDEYFEDEL